MFRRYFTNIVLMLNVFALLSAAVYAEEKNIKNYINGTIDFVPERIVSLGPVVTEELFLLGVGDKLVGCTTYCIRPKEAINKDRVGTIMEVDYEKILSLKPDLVIATPLTNIKTVKKLRALGCNVVQLVLTKNFTEVCGQFAQLAKLVGKEREGLLINKQVSERMDKVQSKVNVSEKPKVFIQIGANPLFGATKDFFINDMVERSSGINVISEMKGNGSVTRESIIAMDPDVIFIITMGIVGEKEKRIWKTFTRLKAVKENNIHIVDSYKVCSPTPVSFVENVEDFVEIFHSNRKVEGNE